MHKEIRKGWLAAKNNEDYDIDNELQRAGYWLYIDQHDRCQGEGRYVYEGARADLRWNPDRQQWEIWALWTDPPSRGKGHARKLLKKIIRKGLHPLVLGVGSSGPLDNDALIRFYSKLGFRRTGDHQIMGIPMVYQPQS